MEKGLLAIGFEIVCIIVLGVLKLTNNLYEEEPERESIFITLPKDWKPEED